MQLIALPRLAIRPAAVGACLVLLLTSACSERKGNETLPVLPAQEAARVVRISGSTTMAPLITALSRNFQKDHPDVSFQIRVGGSGKGLTDVKEGISDIGMVARALTQGELEWTPFVIARDGIALSVHADNPVAALSNAQVAGIYSKKIRNWREVGGRNAEIFVIGASPSAGSTDLFLNHYGVKPADVRPDIVADANSDRFEALGKNPDAILYSSLAESERRAGAGEKVKALPQAGIAATSDNVAAGRYPIARPLVLVTTGPPTGAQKEFIDYARSRAAIPVIDQFEFVPSRD